MADTRQDRTRLGVSGYSQKLYGDFTKVEQEQASRRPRRHAAFANKKRKRGC